MEYEPGSISIAVLQVAGDEALEPAASCVTGRRSNQLNYAPRSKENLCSSDPCLQRSPIPTNAAKCSDRAKSIE